MMKVSVVVPTYNHEKYIAVCLDSILCQNTNFDYEILIGEDDSSDGTRDIVKKYVRDYPSKIKAFYTDRKHVSYFAGHPNGGDNFINLLKNASGEYISLCDGDDYWTNNSKLQQQVDFLDKNSDFSICFHNAIRTDGTEHVLYSQIEDILKSGKAFFELEDLLKSNFIPTASVVFRNKLIGELPDWYFKFAFGDWSLHILNAMHGKIKYIDEPMSVYRIHNSSSWSSKNLEYRYKSMMDFQFFINRFFDFAYDDVIKESIIKNNVYFIKEFEALRRAFEAPKDFLELLKKISKKKIVVFGIGSCGQKIHRLLPVQVSYFSDNDSLKWGQTVSGIVIKDPLEIAKEKKDELAILICSTYCTEIAEQLTEMGFEENEHYWNLYSTHKWLFE
ncbi:glycosyltransferase [Pelosinus propionicus]|uniref:Glycosyltransferase involved in cell wall bisynthesis n=1 Tax=Pelosinus propionicus DSM 13327 TaxID=1123291 RepID=A0A1I4HT84_9FIRM|nr:glycosyltransferase [Pelosinus propionicus]SFL45355.1 Glycosyltransferase involved in cell wall bisynthesis [Pelosinus propionicus DSM 13327]